MTDRAVFAPGDDPTSAQEVPMDAVMPDVLPSLGPTPEPPAPVLPQKSEAAVAVASHLAGAYAHVRVGGTTDALLVTLTEAITTALLDVADAMRSR